MKNVTLKVLVPVDECDIVKDNQGYIQFINQIKQEVGTDYDNINNPVPLFQQLTEA